MKIIFKILKWTLICVLVIFLSGVLFLRFSRTTDQFIYQTSNNYEIFETEFNHREMYLKMQDGVNIHAVLFKPDTVVIGSIFHHLGNGMTLPDAQTQYKPLLDKGFQVFAYERRGFAKSEGEDNDSQRLKMDALEVFDRFLELEEVKGTKVIIWGQSLGGAFATMNAAEREDEINGLIVEGTFTKFPDMGKVYAHVLKMENFKWLIPLIMNNDFPAEENIQEIEKPVVVVHSISDKQVPFELGKKLYESGDASNVEFWQTDGRHISGIKDYEEIYVNQFLKILESR